MESPTEPERPTSASEHQRGTMKAVVRDVYGPPEILELRDVAIPVPAAEQVLVRVHAAGVDRGVAHLVTGLPYPLRLAGYGLRRPKVAVPGMDLAGRVEAVGPGVTDSGPATTSSASAPGRSRSTRARPRPNSRTSRPT